MTAVVCIPARLASSRFPRKVLALLDGRPILQHVYQNALASRLAARTYILADSEEVRTVAEAFGATVLMTSPDCPSGTARIASALDRIDGDIIVNVQGDEPLVQAAVIDAMIERLQQGDAGVATPIVRINDPADLDNPNIVKVARTAAGRALYFSRSAIPYVRDVPRSEWLERADFWAHVGLYAYRCAVVAQYAALPEGRLEALERLEQLRLLEAGIAIDAVVVETLAHGVDVPEDLAVVERRYFSGAR